MGKACDTDEDGDGRNDGSELGELLEPMMDELDAVAGGTFRRVLTGLTEFDTLTAGLWNGTLTVLAGHPGVGVSVLALAIARHAAIRQNIPSVYICYEADKNTVTQRVVSAESGISSASMRGGYMTDDDWTKMAHAMGVIADAPLTICRPRSRDVTAVSRYIDALIADQSIALVVIDSLHYLTARKDLSYENPEREIAEITRRLKTYALDNRIPVVVTSQLSTNPGPRQPFPIPTSLADLRDSGTIAHVADHVVFLHRPDTWDPTEPRRGEADLIVAKNRTGPDAKVTIRHEIHLNRFSDLNVEK